MLRELNVSIGEIKSFMANRTASNMEQLLREKIAELESNIIHLKNVQQSAIVRH